MRTLPPGLAAQLEGGSTTLCRCWRVARRDGAVLGFTDHDRDLAFGGAAYLARSGLDAAEATAELGFAVGGGEVAGALVAAGLTEADIGAGLYDGATVETWLVDWHNVQNRLLLDIGTVGEVKRADQSFVAEVRGLMHRLEQERGLLYSGPCSADLGDDRCRVDLNDPAFSAIGSVALTDGALGVTTHDLGSYTGGWFTGGRLVWISGQNAATAVEAAAHRLTGAGAEIDLWQSAPHPIAAGDQFRITAGCDKRLATCRDKFANVPNHRGFPHMPGNDFVLRFARQGEPGMDGGSLFR